MTVVINLDELSGPRERDERFPVVPRALLEQIASTARRILGCESSAWDVVQESLVCLWLEEKPPPNLKAWLTRVAVHRSLHVARSRRRRLRHESNASRARAESSVRDDPARRASVEESREILLAGLSRLRKNHRDILTLQFVEDLDYESIAARLRIPIGTVRSRLKRSKDALRKTLDGLIDLSESP